MNDHIDPDDESVEFGEPPAWVALLMGKEGWLDYALKKWRLPLAFVLLLGCGVVGWVSGDEAPPQPVAVVDQETQ